MRLRAGCFPWSTSRRSFHSIDIHRISKQQKIESVGVTITNWLQAKRTISRRALHRTELSFIFEEVHSLNDPAGETAVSAAWATRVGTHAHVFG
jgi:hypothetical protein